MEIKKLGVIAFLTCYSLSFSATAVKEVNGNTSINDTESLYSQAINYQAGNEIIGNPAKVKENQIRFFDIEKYLGLINEIQKENDYKVVEGKEWKVKLVVNRPSNISERPVIQNGNRIVSPVKKIRVAGFCEFDRDIEVWGTQKIFVNIPCYLNGLEGVSTLFGVLEPDLNNYSLVLKPIEIYDESGKVWKVLSGYVLNAQRSNENVATYVDAHEIAKILAKAGSDTAQTVKDIVKQRAENAGQTIEVSTTGATTIKETNLDVDVLGQSALWTATASLVEGIADLIKEKTAKIPVTFKISKGSYVFLNAIIEKETYQPIQVSKTQNSSKKNNSPKKPPIVSY